MRSDVAAAEQQYQTILKQIEGSAGKARDLVVSKPATLAQLQQAMREQGFETLMYLVDQERVDPVASQRRRRAHTQRLHSPGRIERQGARALQQSGRPQGRVDAETARELYLFLVAPARPWIRSRRLVIIPSAELHQVPFEALQNPADGGFLGEEFELSYASSATVLLGMKPRRSPRDGALLAVTDPEFKAEVDAVAALYPGRATIVGGTTLADQEGCGLAARRLRRRAPLRPRRVQRPATPAVSSETGPSDHDNGRLTAAEMFGLPLDRANLVVLSACQTGIGSVGNGDELIGMSRALLFAGARSFVLSRWKVDAASTALWMQTFHAEAQRHPLGEAAAAPSSRSAPTPPLRIPIIGRLHAGRPMSPAGPWDDAVGRLQSVGLHWGTWTLIGSFVLYVLGYLTIRFHLSVLAAGTDLEIIDERYLFAGAKFVVYLVSAGVTLLLLLLVPAALAYGAYRLLSRHRKPADKTAASRARGISHLAARPEARPGARNRARDPVHSAGDEKVLSVRQPAAGAGPSVRAGVAVGAADRQGRHAAGAVLRRSRRIGGGHGRPLDLGGP